MRHAIINLEGRVVNIVMWDLKSNWRPSPGLIAIHSKNANIGDFYDQETRKFYKKEGE